jgi:hypothetical protein
MQVVSYCQCRPALPNRLTLRVAMGLANRPPVFRRRAYGGIVIGDLATTGPL